ncbi:MAG: ATP-binding cassette domain-containing protein [Bacteroidia bacterium]|nr:ATP-binding cassette domain-containing protein [Bacteroidia bacterium]
MIRIHELTRTYGTQRAIDAISFEAHPGQVLGFLGPNGAGKSTTMKIIAGFLPPDAGTVTLDEYNILEHPLEIRRRVGYLPEHNPMYLDMYVHEFLDFTGQIYGLETKHRKTRIGEVIGLTGLGREQHKKIGQLSKGYRQRVGLCQALIHDPEVLILDEPTTGLDPNQIVDIRTLIRQAGREKTVIFSSHILSEVEAVADRVIIINRGKIIADAPTDQIRTLAENETRIHLEVEQPGLDLSSLAQTAGYKGIEVLSPVSFTIRSAVSADLRRTVFELCAAQQNPLLAMSRETFSLEDAFRKLTQDAPENS